MPPLNALRAFESAARLQGFTKAADELGVTSGAIAQHIKGLEAWLGTELFHRKAQGVELTPLGKSALVDFTLIFDDLGRAVSGLRSTADPRVIEIAALPSIAQLWLSPRLPALRHAFPEITLSVTALKEVPNLLREPFDLAIFYTGEGQETYTQHIENDVIFPVCCPDVARQILSEPDLENQTLISDTRWSKDWQVWLGEAPKNSGPKHSLYSLAVEDAVNGAGVLIGHRALVERHLAAGTLVAPFTRHMRLDQRLSLILPKVPPQGSAIERLCAKILKVS